MGVMGARRLLLAVVLFTGLIACVSWAGAGSAAAAIQFGSSGEEAEQLGEAEGVAVDAAGDVYVADVQNRIAKFDGSGNWLLAWGQGVIDGNTEMQTCEFVCRKADANGVAPEAFAFSTAVAVDNDPLSGSYGDVYVFDQGNTRVEKFDSNGKFLLMSGGDVNETQDKNPSATQAQRNVCNAGEKCEAHGTLGTADGEFSVGFSISSIAVGPTGDVYVGDKARVQVFEQSGAWKENISLTALSSSAAPSAVAVDSSGDVYVADEGVPGVHEFEPNGTEKAFTFDSASTTVTAIALDSSNDLYVGDSAGGFHVNEYDPAGKQTASFARNTVGGASKGLAFSNVTGEVYADSLTSVWAISPPAPGPLIEGQSATAQSRGAAVLQAPVDPEGNETTVHFEYVDEEHFKSGGYVGATSTTPVSIGSSFNDQSASVSLPQGTLVPGVTYHVRTVAHDSLGHTITGADQVFQETPPALIQGPSATNVAGGSVTFDANIDPLGAATSYKIEYGPTPAYGQVVIGSVGEGMGYVAISRHIQELEASTTYHYRVVTTNEVGTWQSTDHAFTTQAAAGALTLPDGRAWELVSPVNKHGALITPIPASYEVQAASNGSGIAYAASFPMTENAPDRVNFVSVQLLSKRTSSGWTSQEIGTTEGLPEGESAEHEPETSAILPTFFSADLSQTMMEPTFNATQTFSPEVTERTLYIRNNVTSTYVPLVTPSDVPPGTKYGGEGVGTYSGSEQEMRFVMATPDFSHVVLMSPFRLTPEAVEESKDAGCKPSETNTCPQNLYEWSKGRLALVDVLPDGKALPEAGAFLGRGNLDIARAISNDGRRIVWSWGTLYISNSTNTVYMRDMTEGRTLQFGGPKARYETMSSDGSRVFYWERSDLYAFDFATDTTTDLTASHPSSEHRAGVKDDSIMAASEDGTYVYYVATGVLAPGAVSGEDNLYVSHYDGSSWSTTLVATLSKADEFQKEIIRNSALVAWEYMDAEASPNGRYLAFMSSRSLTGYDNTDVSEAETEDNVNGELVNTRTHHDEEVYLYDAVTNRLACASCNPTGARPAGLYDTPGTSNKVVALPLVDKEAHWVNHWIAANLPGWQQDTGPMQPPGKAALHQARYVSNNGRLFFNSSDALVPQDTNGVNDVYEYESAGVGDCTSASATFSWSSGGCVSLLTAGTSSAESAFMDAGENGDDVFFVTSSKLVGEDVDTENDVYDAHVCSASAPCRSEPVSPPECTSGDSCKAAPTPQPEIFGPAPSATFSGTGNYTPSSSSSSPVVKPRSLSKAQKLARALAACHRKKGTRKRMACERQAKGRYGARQARKSTASRRGGR
jgi:hypothetical protein